MNSAYRWKIRATAGILLTVPFAAIFAWIYLTVNPVNGINFTVAGPLLFLLVFFCPYCTPRAYSRHYMELIYRKSHERY